MGQRRVAGCVLRERGGRVPLRHGPGGEGRRGCGRQGHAARVRVRLVRAGLRRWGRRRGGRRGAEQVAVLEGATSNLVIDGCFHSMSRVGTYDEPAKDAWYGSEEVVDLWLEYLV